MEVGIRVEAENIRSGTRRHTNSCYFTMVAVDDAGRPFPVPQLPLVAPVDQRRHRAAEIRRKLRREIAAQLENVAETASESDPAKS
jgi:acyl-CoA hydrolase